MAVFLLKKHIRLYTRFVMSSIFPNFNPEFNLLNMEGKDLNRLKLMLVEKKGTGLWLAEQLGMFSGELKKANIG